MIRFVLAAACLFGCHHTAPTTPAAPLDPPPDAVTTCYGGVATGMGQRARTIARRTVDPAAHQIIEDVHRDDASAHGAKHFHVVMEVSGDQFTMKETGGAFTGTGTLAGEPWRWTSWSSTSQIPHTGIEVESEDELTDKGMTATKQIRKDGKVIATTTEVLRTFPCATWDQAVAALAVPALDDAACERACRNYATLKYWDFVDRSLAGQPQAARDEARTSRAADFNAKLEAGLPACVQQCHAADNPVQTACMGAAQTADVAKACEAE